MATFPTVKDVAASHFCSNNMKSSARSMHSLTHILRQRKHLLLLQPPAHQLHAHVRTIVDLRIICTQKLAS